MSAPRWLAEQRRRLEVRKRTMFTSDDVAFVHTLALLEQMGEALQAYDNITDDAGTKLIDALAAYERGPQP